MSTIERAAAKLVSKPKAPQAEKAPPGEVDPQVKVDPQAKVDRPIEAKQADDSVSQVRDLARPLPDLAQRTAARAEEGVQNHDPQPLDLANNIDQYPAASAEHHSCELDFPWLADNGFLVPGNDNRQQAQEFRRIKRPLLLNMQPAVAAGMKIPTNVIFVTSAVPGEGKTFVSLNLALSLAAELDRRVLLVDGDAAKGDLSRWMGIHGQLGMVDLLAKGQGYGESAIIDTNVDRLQVMPCGELTDNLDEMYASRLMETFIEGLATYDPSRVVVVDGPPLIATTEASVLARRMGQVVMVVEANKTPQALVEQAAAQLEGMQCVSLLLNKATGTGTSGYGYGGYGYGYGQTDRQGDAA